MSKKFLMNDKERKLWVLNDEPLYRWWKSTRKNLASFVNENRQEITEYINKALNKKPIS